MSDLFATRMCIIYHLNSKCMCLLYIYVFQNTMRYLYHLCNIILIILKIFRTHISNSINQLKLFFRKNGKLWIINNESCCQINIRRTNR